MHRYHAYHIQYHINEKYDKRRKQVKKEPGGMITGNVGGGGSFETGTTSVAVDPTL